jgi:hypothetical protein
MDVCDTNDCSLMLAYLRLTNCKSPPPTSFCAVLVGSALDRRSLYAMMSSVLLHANHAVMVRYYQLYIPLVQTPCAMSHAPAWEKYPDL